MRRVFVYLWTRNNSLHLFDCKRLDFCDRADSLSIANEIQVYSNPKGIPMKVRASVKRRCEYCQIVKRNGVIRVICARDARHKQRQG